MWAKPTKKVKMAKTAKILAKAKIKNCCSAKAKSKQKKIGSSKSKNQKMLKLSKSKNVCKNFCWETLKYAPAG